MTRRAFLVWIVAIVAAAATLRGLWLTSDPPVTGGVGIVWHDEGAWVHNARNRALWGTWTTDAWNPVFVAPVFTALEYASFAAFGVGTWQARLVPAGSGLLAVLAIAAGLLAIGGRRTAVIGASILAANYAFVMWNRAALMESTMTSLLVVAWAAYTWAEKRPVYGIAAGIAAVLAWFTKAAAAFFVLAIVVDATLTIAAKRWPPVQRWFGGGERQRGAVVTLAALVAAGTAVTLAFVLPHWRDYAFYNWQMSVTRKPDYSLAFFVNNASWLPVVQGLFSKMPFVVGAGLAGLLGVLVQWRDVRPGQRLLVWWMVLGLLELIVHDAGNERRYVMFIPALVALAALVLSPPPAPRTPQSAERDGGPLAELRGLRRWLLLPAVLGCAYIMTGTLARPFFEGSILQNDLKGVVRLSAALAILSGGAAWIYSDRLSGRLRRLRPSGEVVVTLAVLSVGWNLFQYATWATRRNDVNYRASLEVGRRLSAGALVQGKLANGLSLENRIRPLFVGNGFGNYDDRLRRDDARYILTYELPRIGYESSDGSGLIQEILAHYPNRRTVAAFEVDETPGPDRAVLIDKVPDGSPSHARD